MAALPNHQAPADPEFARFVRAWTALPSQSKDIPHSNVAGLSMALGRMVYLHRSLERKWMLRRANHVNHKDECIYHRPDEPEAGLAPERLVDTTAAEHTRHMEHGRAVEFQQECLGPELGAQTLWRSFVLLLRYVQREAQARAPELAAQEDRARRLLAGQVLTGEPVAVRPELSRTLQTLALSCLALENDTSGYEYPTYWALHRDADYLMNWSAFQETRHRPNHLYYEMWAVARTVGLGETCDSQSDPLALLCHFWHDQVQQHRRRAMARARAAWEAAPPSEWLERGRARWREVMGSEAPVHTPQPLIKAFARGAYELEWEQFASEPAPPEPDWYVLEVACEIYLMPDELLWRYAYEHHKISAEEVKLRLAQFHYFVNELLMHPARTLEKMGHFLDAHADVLVPQMVARGLPASRVAKGLAIARATLAAWRQSVSSGWPALPSPVPAQAAAAGAPAPPGTAGHPDRVAPDRVPVACAREATPPDAPPRAPHRALYAARRRRRARATPMSLEE
jgi:hypothetical protein